MKLTKIFSKILPVVVIVGVWVTLFWPFFRRNLYPIPADIIAGVYYPWLDYKWGFPTGVPVKNPLISDIPSILYPWRSLVIDNLKAFHWPLWNPYYFTGMPLLANFQSAVFSYVNIFFVFLPKALAWSIGVMISSLLTMLFMYAFLRHKNLKLLPSLLGSIVFALCGFEVAWMEYNVHGHTALFLPLLLLAIDKILENKNKYWQFLLPVLIALQIFTGYLPIVIYSWIICFFYILYFYFLPDLKAKRFNLKKYLPFVLFSFWGLLISAIQLFPGFELAKNSVRLIDPTVEASMASYLPLKNLVTFFAPDFFGNPATGNYFGRAFYDNFSLFAGTGTLIMVFYSLFFIKKNKLVIFWAFIFLFSLILSLENPIGGFLQKLFFLTGGVASKALFMADFSLAILASIGLDCFISADKKSKRNILVAIVILAIFLGIIFLFSLSIENKANGVIARRNLIIPFVTFISCSFILIIELFRERLKVKQTNIISSILCFLFLVVVSAQLLYSAGKYLPFSKHELLFPSTPVLDFLRQQQNSGSEPFRVEIGDVVPQNFLMPYGLSATSGYDALLPKRTGEFFSIIESGEVAEKISRVWLIKNYNSPLFPLLNTKYILVKKIDEKGLFSPQGNPPPFVKNLRYKLAFEDKSVQIYEDNKYLPRAFWVHEYELIHSPDDFVKLSQSGIDFKEKVVLEKEPSFPSSKVKSKVDKVVWAENNANKIVLRVESDQPGLVFLANNYFPGWYAYINGKETEIFRANYTFQAIVVAEGSNEIKLIYNPLSFRLGLFITLISFCILSLSAFTSIAFNYPLDFKK